jgi:uncharacterized protein YbjT (DUF2867 family)
MVVLTGATGHLGNVLVRELLSRNVPVRVVIPIGEDTTSLDGLKVEKVGGNVLDLDSLVRAFQGAGVVYHLARILFTSPRRTGLFYEVNTTAMPEPVRHRLRRDTPPGVAGPTRGEASRCAPCGRTSPATPRR